MFCFIFTYILAPLTTLTLNLIFFAAVIPLGLFAWWYYWLSFDHIVDKDEDGEIKKEIADIRRDKLSQRHGSTHD
jgi:hypothetical protein